MPSQKIGNKTLFVNIPLNLVNNKLLKCLYSFFFKLDINCDFKEMLISHGGTNALSLCD